MLVELLLEFCVAGRPAGLQRDLIVACHPTDLSGELLPDGMGEPPEHLPKVPWAHNTGVIQSDEVLSPLTCRFSEPAYHAPHPDVVSRLRLFLTFMK